LEILLDFEGWPSSIRGELIPPSPVVPFPGVPPQLLFFPSLSYFGFDFRAQSLPGHSPFRTGYRENHPFKVPEEVLKITKSEVQIGGIFQFPGKVDPLDPHFPTPFGKILTPSLPRWQSQFPDSPSIPPSVETGIEGPVWG